MGNIKCETNYHYDTISLAFLVWPYKQTKNLKKSQRRKPISYGDLKSGMFTSLSIHMSFGITHTIFERHHLGPLQYKIPVDIQFLAVC